MASLGDKDAFGDLESPIAKMPAGHQMDGHSRFQFGAIATAQAKCVLAPIGGIGQADGIPRAVLFFEAVLLDRSIECKGDVLARIAGLALSRPASSPSRTAFSVSRNF